MEIAGDQGGPGFPRPRGAVDSSLRERLLLPPCWGTEDRAFVRNELGKVA